MKKKYLRLEITDIKFNDQTQLYTAYWVGYNKEGKVEINGEMDFDYEADEGFGYEQEIAKEVFEVLKSEGKVKN